MVKHIDVSENTELLRLVEEVASSGESIVLEKGAVELATIVPAKWRPRKPTPEDVEVSKSTAGSWSDVDVDAFMKYVYEGRKSSKPPVDL